jgi:hypothetical protein
MDQIQRQVSEMALRLLALQPNGAASEPQLLEELESLARQVLTEVKAIRQRGAFSATETGIWPVMKPRP